VSKKLAFNLIARVDEVQQDNVTISLYATTEVVNDIQYYSVTGNMGSLIVPISNLRPFLEHIRPQAVCLRSNLSDEQAAIFASYTLDYEDTL